MYKKIYRNMLFLCTTVLCLLLAIILIACYMTFTSAMTAEVTENAQSSAVLLGKSENREETLEKLNKADSKYSYSIFELNNNCDKNHLCAVAPLDGGGFIHISKSYFEAHFPLYTMIFFVLFMGVLIYLLSLRIAAYLTEGIVKPFSDLLSADSEDMYAEILPLTRAIEYQNKEIIRQTENAQAREVELQLITDNMNEGLVIVDEKGNILSTNDFALKIFGVESHNVKNKHFSVLLNNSSFIVAVEKALKSSRSNALIELGELYYRVYCSPILKNDSPEGVIILLFDITSTYQSEKLRREFSANVSHELKTPLTSINGFAQIISGGIAKEEDIPEFAGKIAKESNRLMILIEDIIRLSNLDEGAPAETESEISVKEIITEVLNSLAEKAYTRNIKILSEGTDFLVTANRTQLNELIYNICDNAIKYNKDNGTVTVKFSNNSVSISDTGIGIPQEYTERIFERFFRVDKSHSKKVDGTGLGLSIVKHIAKQNNIEIGVKSKLGEGSIFTIIFK